MMDPNTLYISKLNEVYLEIYAEDGILKELRDFFTFEVTGAKFMPAYRRGMWDGKIRLFANNRLYVGLQEDLLEWAKTQKYLVVFSDTYKPQICQFSESDIISYFNSIPLFSHGEPIELRDYQMDSLVQSILKKRQVLLSATSSGKSSIIYMLSRFHLEHSEDKVLIIVPTVGLVEQLFSDFKDYSTNNKWSTEDNVHKIYSGQEKDSEKRIFLTTWQSIYKLPKNWFDQFGMVINDECHVAQAKSLTSILEKMVNTSYRIALTGTLQDTKCHFLVIQGLFGPIKKIISTKELMDRKLVSQLSINCILLKYPDEICRFAKNSKDYQKEYDFLIQNKRRNLFIAKLACKTPDNTLIMFKNIEHGKELERLIKLILKRTNNNRKVYFVSGEVDMTEREQIRNICENEENIILICSLGTFSTGISIRNVYDMIFASPTKSRIRNLQSLGRALRLGDRGDKVRLHDIADDLSYKNYQNYSLKHYLYRISLYVENDLNFRQIEYDLYGSK